MPYYSDSIHKRNSNFNMFIILTICQIFSAIQTVRCLRTAPLSFPIAIVILNTIFVINTILCHAPLAIDKRKKSIIVALYQQILTWTCNNVWYIAIYASFFLWFVIKVIVVVLFNYLIIYKRLSMIRMS